MTKTCIPFSVYAGGDAYSTDKKIMGRQSAGKSLVKGITKKWPDHQLRSASHHLNDLKNFHQQLNSLGWTGELKGILLERPESHHQMGTLYYPAPPDAQIAWLRNRFNPQSFSLMGITHTLSTKGATEQVSNLCLPPYQPWDGLICTSKVALNYVQKQMAYVKSFYQEQLGAQFFNEPQLRQIPLGINTEDFNFSAKDKERAKTQLKIQDQSLVILSAGRLSFHAKQNPAPIYLALEELSKKYKLTFIETGVHFNEHIQAAFVEAQKALAPHVRFLHIDGRHEDQYKSCWMAADVFISLSDNIQETFGITPIEAMASGIPVIVSDWDGYKDNVRHGIDGYRIKTYFPTAGCFEDYAWRQDAGFDTPDMYIGRISLATAIDYQDLLHYLDQLLGSPNLRLEMGSQAKEQAIKRYDWSSVLDEYTNFSQDLNQIRQSANSPKTMISPWAIDPSVTFSEFSTELLQPEDLLCLTPEAQACFSKLIQLKMTSYGGSASLLSKDQIDTAIQLLSQSEHSYFSVQTCLDVLGGHTSVAMRSILWLLKFGVLNRYTQK